MSFGWILVFFVATFVGSGSLGYVGWADTDDKKIPWFLLLSCVSFAYSVSFLFYMMYVEFS